MDSLKKNDVKTKPKGKKTMYLQNVIIKKHKYY